MWAWVTGKFSSAIAFLGLLAIVVTSLLRQGAQKEELENEKEKANEQEAKRTKENEINKKVNNVKSKNISIPDSVVFDRLRRKWQRD